MKITMDISTDIDRTIWITTQEEVMRDGALGKSECNQWGSSEEAVQYVNDMMSMTPDGKSFKFKIVEVSVTQRVERKVRK